MRPVILSSPAKVATGLAIGCASAGAAPNARPSARASPAHSRITFCWTRSGKWPTPLFGRPGLIVAGDARAFALVEQAAIGAIGCCRAGQVRLMRLFPGAGLIIGVARYNIAAMVHPAMPARRNRRCVCIAAGIGHIAPIGLAVLIIAV